MEERHCWWVDGLRGVGEVGKGCVNDAVVERGEGRGNLSLHLVGFVVAARFFI